MIGYTLWNYSIKHPGLVFDIFMSWKAHAQYLFKKMCSQEVRRSLRRSSSADSLELKISFIFLYVVRNSWTYTKTTISLIGSLYFTECTDIEVYLREANHDEYLPLQGFIWNQHNDQLPVGLLAQLFERCTCIAEIVYANRSCTRRKGIQCDISLFCK